MNNGDVENIQIEELEQINLMFAFEELYSTIENYIQNSKEILNLKKNKIIEILETVKKITVKELIRIVINKGLQGVENIY